jgi:UDP-N-acetylglucosamine--N-acetylmuramyl-(pentapeptide) pyrophosphoryl-undecaprenol N-acetylglucosamine transferase
MMRTDPTNPHVAIACGGTGGHLFPGMAVGEELLRRNCSVTLLISPKEVDQQAARSLFGMEVVTLPATGLTRGGASAFALGFWNSLQACREQFRARRPDAVLAMGGFTSAPPVLAGKWAGAKTFLHESNTIPGRANRWLAHLVDEAFVYFHEASGRLSIAEATITGMPVRPQFEPVDPSSARMALGLAPDRPVVLVIGGSQGASAVNDIVLSALPGITAKAPSLQFLHLAGAKDVAKVQAGYAASGCKAIVRPFLTEMELALGAATLAISRAGASSLAELAAMQVPSILIPYPTAVDNHQFYNADAFVRSGAAVRIEQAEASGERIAAAVLDLLENHARRAEIQQNVAHWHVPGAAEHVAERILSFIPRAGAGAHRGGSVREVISSHRNLLKIES